MNDTVSDGAVTTLFSNSGAMLSRLQKKRFRALEPECQQTTVEARTFDGVTNTTIHMANPSGTPERDPLNPMAREQKVRSVTALTALTLCRGTVPICRRFARSANSVFFRLSTCTFIPLRSNVNNGSECAPLNFVMASAAFRLCGHHRGRHIALRMNSSMIGTSRADFWSS